jgi:ubiquinone/menaquinone biosynthesis C-methylase UbiE
MALITPPKFKFLIREFKSKSFNLLDVGAGSHSASKTMNIFPQCNYYGIDIRKDYDNDEKDFKVMKGFYEMDLTALHFDKIPDNFFDIIIMSHIIEHLHNGDLVIEGLIPKLKSEGYIYIEYPGQKSTTLPSMKRTLNFYDDPTHVRIFSVPEVSGILKRNNFEILKSGTRRHLPYMLVFPATIVRDFIKHRVLSGGAFWDLLGFAEFVFAKKK